MKGLTHDKIQRRDIRIWPHRSKLQRGPRRRHDHEGASQIHRRSEAVTKPAVKVVKARKAKPTQEQIQIAQVERDVSALDRARQLLGKKILSKAERVEMGAILTTYVRK